ncbi:phospholipase [Uliginosibacterium sp. H3]|uniref:Phospholipase n=1 Tax=Uliginosibacterium silvisoli TaxID=3114758 RepID=A0ABU6K263_9RHOO|nr:phospholipase [Uliginosibacterium sp. H3]
MQTGEISELRQADTVFVLSHRLRQPLPAKPKACVILLHGVGSNESNLASLAAGIDPEVLVVLARGPLQFGPDQYGWFRVVFFAQGPRIDPAEADAARQTLTRFITQLETAYELQPGNTLVAGFSQGGIMSASVALSAPESVRGFAILSGRMLPELEPHIASRERLAHLRAFIAHGEFDSKLPVSWAERSEKWLGDLDVAYETHRYPVDHTLSVEMRQDFLAWVGQVFNAVGSGLPR